MAYKGKTLAAVVPAFNEEHQIGKVITTMPDYVDHIVIIDDCSRDQTSKSVQDFMKDDPRIILIVHEKNQGVGGAIASGYKWARDHDVDMAVVMAGDGQMDPAEMPGLLDPVVDDGVNYAKNNRLIYRGSYDIVPPQRFVANSVLSLLTKIASGYWHIADSQAGYTVADKEVLRTIDWDRMYKRYGQPNDLLIKLNIYDFRVRDVPQRPVYAVGEKSKIQGFKVLPRIAMLLLRGFLWRLREKYIIRDFHPLVFFYFLAFMLLLLGSAFFLRMLFLWVTTGDAPVLSTMAMMFLFATGMQSLFFAMWFDMESNKHLR